MDTWRINLGGKLCYSQLLLFMLWDGWSYPWLRFLYWDVYLLVLAMVRTAKYSSFFLEISKWNGSWSKIWLLVINHTKKMRYFLVKNVKLVIQHERSLEIHFEWCRYLHLLCLRSMSSLSRKNLLCVKLCVFHLLHKWVDGGQTHHFEKLQ